MKSECKISFILLICKIFQSNNLRDEYILWLYGIFREFFHVTLQIKRTYMQQILSSATVRSKLFYLFLFAFIGLFLSASLSGLIFGAGTDNAHNVWTIRSGSFLQELLMFLFPAYTVFAWSYPRAFRALRLADSRKLMENMSWAVAIMCFAYPFTAFLTQLNKEMALPAPMSGLEQWMRMYEDQAAAVTDVLLSGKNVSGLIVNLLLMAVFAALAEEMFFRGALQQLLQQILKNNHLSVWCAAFIFSAVHLQFYGFLPRLVLGAMLGYLFCYSGNLWVAVSAHFFNNAVVIFMMYYRNFNPEAVDWLDNQPVTFSFLLLAMASLALTVVLFRWYKQKNGAGITRAQ